MKNSFSISKITDAVDWGHQWFLKTPERSLEQAYQAALKIKAIEDQYFHTKPISSPEETYTSNILDCLYTDIKKHLVFLKIKLAEFKTSRLLFGGKQYNFFEKLALIDEVINKYNDGANLSDNFYFNNSITLTVQPSEKAAPKIPQLKFAEITNMNLNQKTGILPRSIGRTLHKLKEDIDPGSEKRLLQNFRQSRRITGRAIRTLILLILVPLLVQKASKHFLILPQVEKYRDGHQSTIFLNSEMKEQALKELQEFEEELRFENLLHQIPKIDPEAMEKKVSEKVSEIAENFHQKGSHAISNCLADILGVFAFAGIVIFNPKGIVAIKSLMSEVVYGLSDSAKAFILILFTDMFVGFHSPHGWEVLLEGIANHLGVVANRSAIFLFIATFPVILDTIFKYWIFRYLNQISPSAVATLKNMNE